MVWALVVLPVSGGLYVCVGLAGWFTFVVMPLVILVWLLLIVGLWLCLAVFLLLY